MEQYFAAILPSIEHFHVFGYWVAFLAALLETVLVVGLFLPGSTFLLLLGALSSAGHLDFTSLLGSAIAGAVLGDNVNYWLGQRYGQKWAQRGIWLLTPDRFGKVHRFFDRHGAKSVFLGRFIPSVKEIAPFVAGMAGMHYRTFMSWNILGGIGWGLQWVGGGYLFGQSIGLAQTWMSRIEMVLVAILAVWALLWLFQYYLLRHGGRLWQATVSFGHTLRSRFTGNPYVQQWIRQHPGSIRFLAKRADYTHFFGLPLTLLVLSFIVTLVLLAEVAEDVATADSIVVVDHLAAWLISTFRAPELIPVAIWITSWCAPPVIGVLLVVACLLLWLVNRRFTIAGLVISLLGASLFSVLNKMIFQRLRPDGAVLLEPSYSFPSSHAALSVAFYGFLGYLLIRSAKKWDIRIKLCFATIGFVLLIGLSRIVLGVHYLSDVWAGYLVGLLWLIVGISVNEWLAATGRIDWDLPLDRRRKIMVFSLMFAAIIGVAGYLLTRALIFRHLQ